MIPLLGGPLIVHGLLAGSPAKKLKQGAVTSGSRPTVGSFNSALRVWVSGWRDNALSPRTVGNVATWG